MTRLKSLKTVIAVAACVAATAAQAARPFAPAASCAALNALVEQRGGVVLSTSRTTYDRYVSDGRFCQRTEVTRPAWIVSSDNPECFIGYTCQEHVRGSWY